MKQLIEYIVDLRPIKIKCILVSFSSVQVCNNNNNKSTGACVPFGVFGALHVRQSNCEAEKKQ